MSYYNYIFKAITIDSSEIEKYNEEYQSDYQIFFENCKGFESLEKAVGLSCKNDDGGVIVLKEVHEGHSMIRPRDINFPENTFVNEAGCFIILSEIENHLNIKDLDDREIKDAIRSYIKCVSPKANFVIMAC